MIDAKAFTELQEMKTSNKNVELSLAACEAWVNIVKTYLEGKRDVKYIVIPVIEYSPNSDSGDGDISAYKFITAKYDTIAKEILSIPTDTWGLDIALSRNILVVEKFKLPRIVTLDVIDVKPGVTNTEVEQFMYDYNILKTGNSFHMYAKGITPPRFIGDNIKDPLWKMEYVRISESEYKGPITKYTPPPQTT